jgi:hypothetical protein
VKRRIALTALALVIVACGKRGDPKPPVPIIPAATTDLAIAQRADRLVLTWSYPAMTTAGKNLTAIRKIAIYRYDEALPVVPAGSEPIAVPDPSIPQPIALFGKVPTIPKTQFVKLSNRIVEIDRQMLGAATIGSKLVFADAPPVRSSDGRPMRYTYAVATEGESARGELSNLATIVPLPVAVAPAEVQANARAEGVVLDWKAPSRDTTGGEAPAITGYYVFRTAPGETPNELAAPLNANPIDATTYVDTPAYGEHEYRVAAVSNLGPPLLMSDLSAPVRATFKDLVPPPVPQNLTPLIESDAIRLIWDPVEAPDFAGYKLYRYEAAGHGEAMREVGGFALAPFLITATTWTDNNPAPGIAFRYEVSSVDKSGNESARTKTDWIVRPKTP